MKRISYTTIMILFISLFPLLLSAKNIKVRQTQEVNFSEMNLKGTIRNPDGAYLVQKKGIKFMPLYNIQIDLDKKLRDVSLYSE